jgi:hypothetical protein
MSDPAVVAVDRNIPIPSELGRAATPGSWQPKYPWANMAIGDSFLVPGAKSGWWSAYHKAGRRLGRTFIVRTTPEGLRCWRVA